MLSENEARRYERVKRAPTKQDRLSLPKKNNSNRRFCLQLAAISNEYEITILF